MQDYRDEALKMVDAANEETDYVPELMCIDGAKSILELTAEVEKLRAKLTKKRRKFKRDFKREYGTMSPNAKGHAKLQTFNFNDPIEEEKAARRFADLYRELGESNLSRNIHADAEASGVWRYVGPWNYLPGYEPKGKNELV
jgi:hypothetical protein